MSYHESFWVVAGTAAPIIALAAVAALPETVSLQDKEAALAQSAKEDGLELTFTPSFPLRKFTTNEKDAHDRLRRFAFRVYSLTVSNVIIQAGLLAVSLSALAVGRNVMPPWIAIVLAAGGILGLAQTLVWPVVIRGNSRRVDEKFRAASERAAESFYKPNVVSNSPWPQEVYVSRVVITDTAGHQWEMRPPRQGPRDESGGGNVGG